MLRFSRKRVDLRKDYWKSAPSLRRTHHFELKLRQPVDSILGVSGPRYHQYRTRYVISLLAGCSGREADHVRDLAGERQFPPHRSSGATLPGVGASGTPDAVLRHNPPVDRQLLDKQDDNSESSDEWMAHARNTCRHRCLSRQRSSADARDICRSSWRSRGWGRCF